MIRMRGWTLGIAMLFLANLIGPGALSASAAAPIGMMPGLVRADVDTDDDGLTDAREAELDTDPALADTDGDGLLDGDEVDEFGTDPFTFDSDEDTFPDPLEIEAGTDPLDPDSTPLDPDAIRTLDVTIFACPPGTTDPAPHTCETAADVDVTVALAGSAPLETRKTDANGFVSFTGLAAGTYVITEDVPGDAPEDLQVRCGAGGEGFEVEPSGNGITLVLGLGGRYGCSFFNIVADQGIPEGGLIVGALICPTDYDGADYFAVCEQPAQGVTVTVRAEPAGDSLDAETDASGLVGFAGLDIGAYRVELGVPGDFARFKVFCGLDGAPEFFELAESETNVIDLDLGDAPVSCIWFIVPEDSGAPTATVASGTTPAGGVGSLPNTGTGSASAVGGSSRAADSLIMLMVLAAGLVLIRAFTWRLRGR